MKLYEKLAERGYHTTIMTTYAIDFAAFEDIALSRLRGSGSRNNILLVDETMLQLTLSSTLPKPGLAGRHYSVTGIRSKGAFHPKIILQIGRDKGRLLIGSANMTASGLAGNLELEAVIECDASSSSSQQIIAACWEYLGKLFDWSNNTIANQLNWMKARANWLNDATPTANPFRLDDRGGAAFISTQRERGIFEQLANLIVDDIIGEITILSPYWDKDLSTVKRLIDTYEPSRTRLLVDTKRALFPNVDFTDFGDVELLDLGLFGGERFIHAKLIVLTSASKDHVLFGSANCTVAAMGHEEFIGNNEEACIYRTYDAGYILEELALAKLLEQTPIKPAELPEFTPGQDPEENSGLFDPGRFESHFGQLRWIAPKHLANESMTLRLFDHNDQQLAFEESVTYEPSGSSLAVDTSDLTHTPAFARLYKHDGSESAPAIVTVLETIQSELKEVRSSSAQRAFQQLSEAAEEGLWILEIWEQLQKSEDGITTQRSQRPTNKSDKPDEKNHQALDYQSFIQGARLRQSKSGTGRNSLAGSELSSMRAFLNRLLSIHLDDEGEDAAKRKAEDETIFDLGDEVANPEEAIEKGSESTAQSTQENNSAFPSASSLFKRRKSQEDTWNKVTSYIEGCNAETKRNPLSTKDLLLFRSLLMIVSAAGYAGSESDIRIQGRSSHLGPLQVLPTTGSEHNWPRLLSMLLRTMFGGSEPRINRLHIDNSSDVLPDDVIEYWATCYWCAQACSLATLNNPIKGFDNLRVRIYLLTGLTPEQFDDSQIELIMNRFNERLCERLGLNSALIMEAHSRSVLGLAGAAE